MHDLSNKQATLTQVYTIEPDQGALFFLNSAPEGYRVERIDRQGTKATVTYSLIATEALTNG